MLKEYLQASMCHTSLPPSGSGWLAAGAGVRGRGSLVPASEAAGVPALGWRPPRQKRWKNPPLLGAGVSAASPAAPWPLASPCPPQVEQSDAIFYVSVWKVILVHNLNLKRTP